MEILNTKETADKILEIIKNAEKEVIIMSPYLDLKDKYKKAIKKNKEANIIFIYGKKQLNDDVEEFLKKQYNITILVVKNLHAKVYMNEKEAIISSMNLYKFSEENNFEISVYTNEIKKIEELQNKIEELVNEKMIFSQKISEKISQNWGFCIRTGVKIDYNTKKPFCYEAFKEWNLYKNVNYREKYCHKTGQKSFGKTSFLNPELKE